MERQRSFGSRCRQPTDSPPSLPHPFLNWSHILLRMRTHKTRWGDGNARSAQHQQSAIVLRCLPEGIDSLLCFALIRLQHKTTTFSIRRRSRQQTLMTLIAQIQLPITFETFVSTLGATISAEQVDVWRRDVIAPCAVFVTWSTFSWKIFSGQPARTRGKSWDRTRQTKSRFETYCSRWRGGGSPTSFTLRPPPSRPSSYKKRSSRWSDGVSMQCSRIKMSASWHTQHKRRKIPRGHDDDRVSGRLKIQPHECNANKIK